MTVSKRGLPATEQVLDNTRPMLRRLDPFLRNFTPIVDYLGLYKREIAAFFGNDAAATQGTEQGFNEPGRLPALPAHANPVNPEIMAGYPYRLGTNRSNPYTEPGGYDKLSDRGPARGVRQLPLHLAPDAAPAGAQRVADAERSPRQIEQFIFGGTGEPRRGAALRPAGAARAARRPAGRSSRTWNRCR